MAAGEIVDTLPTSRAITAASRASWRDYLTLTKPRIMSLLVLTAVCSMFAAAGGDPAPTPLAALLLGGALACGGASALNHVLDRDIDLLHAMHTQMLGDGSARKAAANHNHLRPGTHQCCRER